MLNERFEGDLPTSKDIYRKARAISLLGLLPVQTNYIAISHFCCNMAGPSARFAVLPTSSPSLSLAQACRCHSLITALVLLCTVAAPFLLCLHRRYLPPYSDFSRSFLRSPQRSCLLSFPAIALEDSMHFLSQALDSWQQLLREHKKQSTFISVSRFLPLPHHHHQHHHHQNHPRERVHSPLSLSTPSPTPTPSLGRWLVVKRSNASSTPFTIVSLPFT
jgi:hypothetical protein